MTEDEKIMLHSLKFIERESKYIPSGHVNMLTTLWKNWDDYKQNYFRDLLWEKEFVHLATYHWELQTTTAGKKFIKTKDKEIEDELLQYLIKERDVRDFMISNFIEPNSLSNETINKTDDGVVFLKDLKHRKLIEYDDGVLNQINTDLIPRGNDQHKRWFNSMTGAFYVTPLSQSDPLLSGRLSKSKFALKQIKYAIKVAWKYSLKLLISIWKYLVLASLVYLGVGDHFEKVLKFIKNFFK